MNGAGWVLNKCRRARYNRRMSPSSSLAEQFLIAMPGMQDPHFARTVSLICQHDAQGAMGLVLNQDSEFNLGELFDQLDLECRNQDLRAMPVLSGGPVQTERGFVLHQDGRSWDSSMHLANGLTVTTSRDILQASGCRRRPRPFPGICWVIRAGRPGSWNRKSPKIPGLTRRWMPKSFSTGRLNNDGRQPLNCWVSICR